MDDDVLRCDALLMQFKSTTYILRTSLVICNCLKLLSQDIEMYKNVYNLRTQSATKTTQMSLYKSFHIKKKSNRTVKREKKETPTILLVHSHKNKKIHKRSLCQDFVKYAGYLGSDAPSL